VKGRRTVGQQYIKMAAQQGSSTAEWQYRGAAVQQGSRTGQDRTAAGW
jgi:hypothetical protein